MSITYQIIFIFINSQYIADLIINYLSPFDQYFEVKVKTVSFSYVLPYDMCKHTQTENETKLLTKK